MNTDSKNLHQQFISLGRERNKITYKLLVLLPQIYEQKIYKTHGYATIYEYAGKLAGLSHSVVEKALKLEEKLKDKPDLQKAIETQGIHKVAIIATLATPENEKMFADKVENMSKQALQQFSREFRGKIQTRWNIEMDTEMMSAFLKLKDKIGKNLSNKEALRRMLKMLGEKSQLSGVGLTREVFGIGRFAGAGMKCGEGRRGELCVASYVMAKNEKPQPQAKNNEKIPGEKKNERRSFFSFSLNLTPNQTEQRCPQDSTMTNPNQQKTEQNFRSAPSRYIPIAKKREILAKTNGICSYENCCNPAQIFHHQIRFFQTKNHISLIPLCKIHHEFAHNGITEPMTQADELYRKYRQAALP